jgi:hypothetical protein
MHKRIRAAAETAENVAKHLRHIASVEHRRSTSQLATALEAQARRLERTARDVRNISSDAESGGWFPPFFQK